MIPSRKPRGTPQEETEAVHEREIHQLGRLAGLPGHGARAAPRKVREAESGDAGGTRSGFRVRRVSDRS
jgi:hypothetical protein